eukprot:gnl/TRDRNA2_/TRDRNA2_200648_c0_seq1.p1 gnl/TRDRNA2_/TRDRNA2_200648_c0~~gnl/TRDRNA2_/TRDRNA2_200648_c0_seq1.p1  ORF type:complete len:314 (+),score=62.99 gnl/TRDRNA2_/TRDRNA2_200648_c0_seq1:34-975(+)
MSHPSLVLAKQLLQAEAPCSDRTLVLLSLLIGFGIAVLLNSAACTFRWGGLHLVQEPAITMAWQYNMQATRTQQLLQLVRARPSVQPARVWQHLPQLIVSPVGAAALGGRTDPEKEGDNMMTHLRRERIAELAKLAGMSEETAQANWNKLESLLGIRTSVFPDAAKMDDREWVRLMLEPSAVAKRIVTLKMILPTLDLESVITKKPSLLLEDEDSLRRRATKTTRLLGAAVAGDIGKLVSRKIELLDPEKCQEYVDAAKCQRPETNRSWFDPAAQELLLGIFSRVWPAFVAVVGYLLGIGVLKLFLEALREWA